MSVQCFDFRTARHSFDLSFDFSFDLSFNFSFDLSFDLSSNLSFIFLTGGSSFSLDWPALCVQVGKDVDDDHGVDHDGDHGEMVVVVR